MSRKAGSEAEEKAAQYLRRRGYRVIERNFSCRMGEIDIVARDGETVVFVEVRSRAPSAYGIAAETVNGVKRRKLVKTALLYCQARGLDCPLRFDVVAIDGESLDHIEDAFQV